MPVNAPTPGHQLLDRLIGTWVGEETIHPSPIDPVGGTSLSLVYNRSALSGFGVIQDYEQARGGEVVYRGHGVFRYDAATDRYGLHWFDSSGRAPGEFLGSFEGDVLALTMTAPQGQIRASWHFTGADRIDYRMELSENGGQWTPFVTARYSREV